MGSIGSGLVWIDEPWDDIDWEAFQENSRQLDEFLEGDFSSMEAELQAAFPNSWRKMIDRFVPLVERMAQEQATLYAVDAFRTFGGVNSEQNKKLLDIYRNSKLDEKFNHAHRRLVPQRTMVMLVLPDGPRRYTLRSYAPWEMAVSTASGMDVQDITKAREVRLRWPLGTVNGSQCYGWMTLTQDEIFVQGNGDKIPVFPGGGNPFGRIPLVTVRTNTPKSGRFFGSVDEPLLSLAIAMNLGDSDRNLIAHFQAHGQKVLEFTGEDVPTNALIENLKTGPDTMLAPLIAGAKFSVVGHRPDLDQYGRLDENSLKVLAMMRDMSPNRFMKANTAQTGAARQADREDREESRRVWKRIWRQAEQEVFALIGEMSRMFNDPVPIPETATLSSVRWNALQMIPDPAQEANANKVKDESGESSAVERVSIARNVGRSLAKSIVVENRADTLAVQMEAAAKAGVVEPEPAQPPANNDA
jgi:hypothetical protein